MTGSAFNQTMRQLFQSTMRKSNPKLAPELFDHNSASEAAIEIQKNILMVDKLSGNRMQFLNKPFLKQMINGSWFFRGGVYVPTTKKHVHNAKLPFSANKIVKYSVFPKNTAIFLYSHETSNMSFKILEFLRIVTYK